MQQAFSKAGMSLYQFLMGMKNPVAPTEITDTESVNWQGRSMSLTATSTVIAKFDAASAVAMAKEDAERAIKVAQQQAEIAKANAEAAKAIGGAGQK